MKWDKEVVLALIDLAETVVLAVKEISLAKIDKERLQPAVSKTHQGTWSSDCVPILFGKELTMSMFNIHEFQQQVDGIVKEYLYKISSLKKHNYFKNEKSVDIQPKSLRNHAFGLLDCDFDNYYVVEEEMFLEGCTRVFLINPIFKILLEVSVIIFIG